MRRTVRTIKDTAFCVGLLAIYVLCIFASVAGFLLSPLIIAFQNGVEEGRKRLDGQL